MYLQRQYLESRRLDIITMDTCEQTTGLIVLGKDAAKKNSSYKIFTTTENFITSEAERDLRLPHGNSKFHTLVSSTVQLGPLLLDLQPLQRSTAGRDGGHQARQAYEEHQLRHSGAFWNRAPQWIFYINMWHLSSDFLTVKISFNAFL